MKVGKRVYLAGGADLTGPKDGAVYLVDGGTAFAMIDAGCGENTVALANNIKSIKPEMGAAYIVATHGHIDHIGGMAALQRQVGGVVVAHNADSHVIENVDVIRSGANLYRMTYEPCPVGLTMDGEQMTLVVGDLDLHLWHIPGHTPGSICAWFEQGGERVLFAQDLHGPIHPAWGSDITVWRNSLKKMLSLEADLLCEGHFGVFYGQEQVEKFIKSYLFR